MMVFEGTKLHLRAVREINPDEEVRESSHINNTEHDCSFIDVATGFLNMFLSECLLNELSLALSLEPGPEAVYYC